MENYVISRLQNRIAEIVALAKNQQGCAEYLNKIANAIQAVYKPNQRPANLADAALAVIRENEPALEATLETVNDWTLANIHNTAISMCNDPAGFVCYEKF